MELAKHHTAYFRNNPFMRRAFIDENHYITKVLPKRQC